MTQPSTSGRGSTDEGWAEAALARYRARCKELDSEGRAKSDMIAFSELRAQLTPEDRYGHIPGIKVGVSFNNRGELAILGLHTQIMRGIYCKKPGSGAGSDKGALAIVLAGGYADDSDEGEAFWYTGEGGQEKGKQVRDQTFTGGNLALKHSHETGTPVRVFRGSKVTGRLQYTYEGLYKVTDVRHEASKDGPLVCRFRMEGVPGESVVTLQVLHRSLYRNVLASRLGRNQLAAAGPDQPKAKKPKLAAADSKSRAKLVEELKGRPGLIEVDISGGLEENIPIPLFNDVNDRKLDPGFSYIADMSFAPGAREQAAEVLQRESQKLMEYARYNETKGCGVAFRALVTKADLAWLENLKARPEFAEWAADSPALLEERFLCQEHNYSDEGCLLSTEPCGIHECGGPLCTSAACVRNMQVTRGIRVPLEVFMTPNKGWGVRCREPLTPGAFVCCYIGEVVTESMVKVLAAKEEDHYLFTLDFFLHLFKDIHENGMDVVEPDAPAHKIPPPPQLPFPAHLLVAPPFSQQQQQQQQQGAAAAMLDGSPACTPKTGQAAGGPFIPESPLSPAGRRFEPPGLFDAPLSLDAYRRGNVGRFINHCCEPNLVIQGVFAGEYRSTLLYYVALFAGRDIPAGEELTYDYGYFKQGHQGGRGMHCHCGAPSCKGVLL